MLRHILVLQLIGAPGNAPRNAPVYTIDGVVNAATNRPGPIAPNTLVSLYGAGLCFATRSISPEDLRGGILPNVLPGTGCRVSVGNLYASIYYASPTQINFLVPSSLLATTVELQAVMNGVAGLALKISLAEVSPGLFESKPGVAVVTRGDGSIPAEGFRPGDTVVLYGTGLGRTSPAAIYSQVATGAAPLARGPDFRLVLDGVDTRAQVEYVGATPGFAGLYQINLILPMNLPPDPQIRIGFGEDLSPEGIRLPVRSLDETPSDPAALNR